jgi:hypothetical protein
MPSAEIIYNVTTQIDSALNGKWLSWLKQEHIPKVLATGCFFDAVILKLEEQDNEGIVYAVQYHAAQRTLLEKYKTEFEMKFIKDTLQKWGDNIVQFATILQVVN